MERSLVGDATGSRVAPIRPCEVEEMKGTFLPSTVFEAFNELIARNFCDGSASVLQSDVVSLMVKKGLDEYLFESLAARSGGRVSFCRMVCEVL